MQDQNQQQENGQNSQQEPENVQDQNQQPSQQPASNVTTTETGQQHDVTRHTTHYEPTTQNVNETNASGNYDDNDGA